MPTQKTSTKESINYLHMAQTGHYPLFYKEWLEQSLQPKHNINLRKANTNVQQVFGLLSRHKTLEKKKTALIGMEKSSREQFIRSFFKVVEHNILKDVNTLQ